MRKRQKSGKSSGFVLDHFRFRLNASLEPTTLFLFRFPHLAKGSFNLRNPGLREEILLSLVPQTGPSPWNEGLSANSFHSAHALFPPPSLSFDLVSLWNNIHWIPFPRRLCSLFLWRVLPFRENFGVPAKGDVERKRNSVEHSGTEWSLTQSNDFPVP